MLQYVKNKYDTYFNNSIEQITIAKDNLKYNQDTWYIYNDIFNNIIDFMLVDFNSIYALYFTSKMFHHSMQNIKKIVFDADKFDCNKLCVPIFRPEYHINLTKISLKNFVFEISRISKPTRLLSAVISYWRCKDELELISCVFKGNDFNPFSILEYRKSINKIYINNVKGLNYSWIPMFRHDGINEIIICDSPDVESNEELFNTGFNTKCKINKISMIHCNISAKFFFVLMKRSSQTNISSIDLSHNLIKGDCNNYIYDCLKSFSNLKTLNLTGNLIDIDQINVWRGSNSSIEILF